MLFLLHWHIVWFQYSSNKYPFVTIPTSALVNLALVFNLSWIEGDRLGRACPQDDGCHDFLDQLSKGQNNVKNPGGRRGGECEFQFLSQFVCCCMSCCHGKNYFFVVLLNSVAAQLDSVHTVL